MELYGRHRAFIDCSTYIVFVEAKRMMGKAHEDFYVCEI